MNNLKITKDQMRNKNPHLYLFLKSKGRVKKFQVNKKIYDSLKESEWFDKKYYNEHYPNIKNSQMDPLLHYILFGFKEGKFPSKKFKETYHTLNELKLLDKKYYYKRYPNIKNSQMDPLLHYILIGDKEGKFPSEKFEEIYNSLKDSGLFDESFYNKNCTDVTKWGLNPLLHYILFGYRECKFPSEKFEEFYNALKDSEFFDALYYSRKYPNVMRSGVDPLIHYIIFGYREGKFPSFKFDGNYYLKVNKDVKKLDINPLVHYVLYGRDEEKIIKSNSENHKFADLSDEVLSNILFAFDSKKKIIINYICNDFNNAEKTIQSILENTQIDYELIIIDDNSSDNKIKTLLKKYKYI